MPKTKALKSYLKSKGVWSPSFSYREMVSMEKAINQPILDEKNNWGKNKLGDGGFLENFELAISLNVFEVKAQVHHPMDYQPQPKEDAIRDVHSVSVNVSTCFQRSISNSIDLNEVCSLQQCICCEKYIPEKMLKAHQMICVISRIK